MLVLTSSAGDRVGIPCHTVWKMIPVDIPEDPAVKCRVYVSKDDWYSVRETFDQVIALWKGGAPFNETPPTRLGKSGEQA